MNRVFEASVSVWRANQAAQSDDQPRDPSSSGQPWLQRWASGAVVCAMLSSSAPAQPIQSPVAPPPASAPASTPWQAFPYSSLTLSAAQITLLRRTLAQADADGFAPGEFIQPDLDANLQSRRPDLRRAGQDELVAGTLRYAQAVHSGQLTVNNFIADWGLHPAAYDPSNDFSAAAAVDRLGPWLDSLPPPYPGYTFLRTALGTYRQIAANGGWSAVADGPPLKRGDTGPRVAALRARLMVEDSTVSLDGAHLYDAHLEAAVIRAQKRYGLDPNGVVGAATLEALNVPVSDRIDQIKANMERWRWLPATLPADRIQVNIAAAVLTLFQDDTPRLSMKAVTGRPGDETPMLQSQISSIVFNPPWNVPYDIATKELWPKERAHPGYLAQHDFRVITNDDGSTRLQQKAGSKAALGHVKFDFANTYGVYLHDTPSHGGFSKYTRQESHGCVRLEHPVDLAKTLMDGDPKWTPVAIDQIIATGSTTVRTPVPAPIAVFLLYWTAFVGADGQTNFRADPYGWDDLLVQRIAAAARRSA